MHDASPVLVLDTASPVVSVAVAAEGRALAQRTIELRRSSEFLLATIDAVLDEAKISLRELVGVAALQGPGSFTGLRIGLATVLGLHQATSIPATAIPTHPVLATAAPPGDGEIVAVVDAIRGQWSSRRFRVEDATADPIPLARAELVDSDALLDFAPCRVVGFGSARLTSLETWKNTAVTAHEPPPLAAIAASTLSRRPPAWDSQRLTQPIYSRPPQTTPPRPNPK